jgi:hypothetical protein
MSRDGGGCGGSVPRSTKPLKSLVRRFAAAVRAVVCGALQTVQENQGAAVLRWLRWSAPHTPV